MQKLHITILQPERENYLIMDIEKKETSRGFDVIEFTDRYYAKCSIQKSSLATENAIWFGANEINLRMMDKNSGLGWVQINTAGDENLSYIANNRMHLTQEQVKSLLPILTKFAETGEL